MQGVEQVSNNVQKKLVFIFCSFKDFVGFKFYIFKAYHYWVLLVKSRTDSCLLKGNGTCNRK